MVYKLAKLNTPSYRLIAKTTWNNWLLLALNLGTNLGSALFEGSTLAIIYLAISSLNQETLNWQKLGPLLEFTNPRSSSIGGLSQLSYWFVKKIIEE